MKIFLIWILVVLGSKSALKTSDDEDEYEEDGSGVNPRGNELSQFEDTCPYDGFNGRCGDKCAVFCMCGDQDVTSGILLSEDDFRCCIPPTSNCSHGELGSIFNARCPEGEVRSISERCPPGTGPTACYNSYTHSEDIGSQSHYECPDSCVPLENICQGVSFCGHDVEECRDGLRCKPGYSKHKLNTELIEGHNYCVNVRRNNGSYELLDRSDEDIIRSLSQNFSQLTPCTTNKPPFNPGLVCGDECLPSEEWCDGARPRDCGNGVTSTSADLCSNHTFWRNISCKFLSENHNQFLETTTGVRCQGTNAGSCIYPAYTWEGAYAVGGPFRTTCSDKSDSIFQRNKSCPAPATGVDYSTRHIHLFPERTRDLSSIELNTLMTRID